MTPGMRLVVPLVLLSTPALAEGVVPEAVLGQVSPPTLVADTSACSGAEGAPLFWLEVAKTGKVTAAKVHGAGRADACFAKALAKAKVKDKLAAPIVVTGHIDVEGQTAPRTSQAPIVLDNHHTKWQLTASQLHYTANRMMDIAAGLDGASNAVASCADRRPTAGRAMVWHDGKVIVRSGTKPYDACLAKALSSVKLPAPESAFWIQLDIAPPGEQLAPHTDNPQLSHERALKDAVNTAVRSRKLDINDCLQPHPKATVTAVTVSLYGEKLTTKKVTTSDAAVDKCVRGKLDGVKIPNAAPTDKLELEVELLPGV
jgi:hypothetical protein